MRRNSLRKSVANDYACFKSFLTAFLQPYPDSLTMMSLCMLASGEALVLILPCSAVNLSNVGSNASSSHLSRNVALHHCQALLERLTPHAQFCPLRRPSTYTTSTPRTRSPQEPVSHCGPHIFFRKISTWRWSPPKQIPRE